MCRHNKLDGHWHPIAELDNRARQIACSYSDQSFQEFSHDPAKGADARDPVNGFVAFLDIPIPPSIKQEVPEEITQREGTFPKIERPTGK